MSGGTIAAIFAVAVLALLLWLTLREALSERSRERIAAVGRGIAAIWRFFVTPRNTQEKEVPREPAR